MEIFLDERARGRGGDKSCSYSNFHFSFHKHTAHKPLLCPHYIRSYKQTIKKHAI